MAKDDIYQVTTTFVGTVNGREVEYHTGEVVDADDPAFKLFPQYFGPVEFKHRAPKPPKAVEEPTAAPAGKAITTAGFKGR